MDLTSTPFLSYREIKSSQIDLYEDAFGLTQQFSDVIGVLKLVKPIPGKRLIQRVTDKARKNH